MMVAVSIVSIQACLREKTPHWVETQELPSNILALLLYRNIQDNLWFLYSKLRQCWMHLSFRELSHAWIQYVICYFVSKEIVHHLHQAILSQQFYSSQHYNETWYSKQHAQKTWILLQLDIKLLPKMLFPKRSFSGHYFFFLLNFFLFMFYSQFVNWYWWEAVDKLLLYLTWNLI